MRDTYFSINECTEEELNQLREALFYNEEDNEDLLTEEEYAFIRDCKTPDDIPFELLKKFYGHISFVDEDFWCNCKEKESDEIDEHYFLMLEILEQFN